MFFAWDLNWTPNPTFSGITVQAQDSVGGIFPMTIEQIQAIPAIPGLSEIVVLLPTGLAGEAQISVTVNGNTSNKVLIAIQ